MTEHLLTIQRDTAYEERLNAQRAERGLDPVVVNDLTGRITCLHPDACTGFQECGKEHPDGAADRPWESDENAPWYDEEEFEFHGELHTWRSDHGWTVTYVGCVVQGADYEIPDELYPLQAGAWIVDDEWDDTVVYLTVVRPAEPAERSAA